MRIVLIGIGTMGKKYCKMLSDKVVDGLQLVGVVCRNKDAESYVLSCDENIIIYKDMNEMFQASDSYDAVLICTPHKSHAEIAIKAFELGKHVLCDKPAGATISQANAMQAAAQKSGKLYAMMFHQRCYEKYRKIKQLIDSRELGKLKRLFLVNSRFLRTSHYHNSAAWRSSWTGEGGGALINQGQHILDMWQWIFGMPESLYADIPFGKYNDFMVDDEATIIMRYKDNLTATFILTTGEAVWQEKLEVIGSKGKAVLEDDRLTIIKYSEDSDDYIRNSDFNSREGLQFTEEVIDFNKGPEPYLEMFNNFVKAVSDNDEKLLIANGKDSVNPLMLTNAAYYSAYNNVRVELPLNPKEYDLMLKELMDLENAK